MNSKMDFDPPPRKTDMSPLLGVMGEPFTKKEYAQRTHDLMQGFMQTHPAKVRAIVDMITKLTDRDIDQDIVVARDSSKEAHIRAKAAFNIVAWNAIIKPYGHHKRGYFFVNESFVKLIHNDHQYLYMYAVSIHKKPSLEIHARLKVLHAPTAKAYRDYCRDYALATFEFESIDWMFGG